MITSTAEDKKLGWIVRCIPLHRALLREEVSSGRLDKAPSKADVLAELCNRLNFDPDAASALHKQLYRQKLDSLLEKKGLTGETSQR